MAVQESRTTIPAENNGASLKALLQDLRSETTELLQKEAQLARAEISEKASRLGAHATRIGVGAFIAYAGLIVLLFGLGDLAAVGLAAAGLSEHAALWVGRCAVGLLVALIGWMMLAQAKKAAKSDDLVPDKTLRSLRENKQWMQHKLQHSHESP